MADFSDCTSNKELIESLRDKMHSLAQQHKEESEYDEPQFVLRNPDDPELAQAQEAEFDEVVQAAADRAEQIFEGDELIDKRPLWEHYGEAGGDFYADGW